MYISSLNDVAYSCTFSRMKLVLPVSSGQTKRSPLFSNYRNSTSCVTSWLNIHVAYVQMFPCQSIWLIAETMAFIHLSTDTLFSCVTLIAYKWKNNRHLYSPGLGTFKKVFSSDTLASYFTVNRTHSFLFFFR